MVTQVILAFSLVLAYDLLEDRCTIDVIIAKFFPVRFKIAECFKSLDNFYLTGQKIRYQKVLSRH